jgi:serine/threonine-protein kinase RsbT
MDIEPTLVPSPLVNGQIKAKPRRALTPGIVERLMLHQPLDVAIARTAARKLADDLGYSLIDQVRLSTAVFDLTDAVVTYAGQGELVTLWREEADHKGLQFLCHDQGRRSPQLTAIWQNSNTENSWGCSSLQKLVDECLFTANPEQGNCITITIWLE